MIREDLSKKRLDIFVVSTTDDRDNAFDFDSHLPLVIDRGFHASNIRQCVSTRKCSLAYFSQVADSRAYPKTFR